MKKIIWYVVILPTIAAFTFIVGSLSSKLVRSFQVTAQDNQHIEKTQPSRPIRTRIEEMPQIVSETPSLQLIHTEVKPHAGLGDFLFLTFRNNSPKAIFSFTICTLLDEYGRTSISFYAGRDAALEYVAPYGEKTIEISAGNITPDHPLTLCAVTFSDESQEGMPDVLETDKQSMEEAKRQRHPQ